MTAEQIWRRKSDDELLAAANRLGEYTEEGQQVIRAEVERRRTPEYLAEARAAARRVEQERVAAASSPTARLARRVSLLGLVLTVPLIGFGVAKGLEASFGAIEPGHLAPLAVGAGAVGAGLIALIALAGLLARRSRTLLLAIFQPGLYVTAVVLTGLILVHAIVLMESIYFVEYALVKRVSLGILVTVGLGAIGGVAAVARSAFSHVKRAQTGAVGRIVSRREAPRLWDTIERTAERLGALKPEHVVVGLDPNFFVTEADVATLGERLTGRTLYCSLSLARILTTDEFVAIIGHELGHFRGADTQFSERFYPIYRGTAAAIVSLHGVGRGWRRAALLPAIAIFGFFLEAFSVAERTLGRERELAADQAGASVTDPRVMATALVKVHAYCGIWGDLQGVAAEALREGRPIVNISRTYADTVAQRATQAPFEGILGTHLSHPTDSHPTLSARLASLSVDLNSVAPAALLVAPGDAAIALVPNADATEQEISAAYQSLMAGHLGIDVADRGSARSGRSNPIKRCAHCGRKVLPTAQGLCPSCGVAI